MNRRRMWIGVVALGVLLAISTRAEATADVNHQAWARTSAIPTFVSSSDRMYVAATAGDEEARSYVRLHVDDLAPEALHDAHLILTAIPEEGTAATEVAIDACALAEPLTADGEISSSDAPAADCTLRVDAIAVPDDDTWSVPLAVFAERWTTVANEGLVLFPASDAPTATFRVVFDTTETTLTRTTEQPEVSAPAEPQDNPDASVEPQESPERPEEESSPGVVPPAPPADSGPEPGPVLSAGPLSNTQDSQSIMESPQPSGRQEEQGRVRTGALAASSPDAATPSALWVLAAFGLVATALLLGPPKVRRRLETPPRVRAGGSGMLGVGALGAVMLLPLAFSEAIVFKAGLVVIFLVAALGLHVLVNWAGELSLAHAGVVGLPAFVVLAVSETYQISPIYLLPVGLVTGAVIGTVVGLPALRARGLQVALVTLVAGIAVQRFFFTKSWLVGDLVVGRTAATPALGPLEFTSSKGLYPVLLVIVVATFVLAWIVLHSKLARGWFWVRSDPAAAAAFGIPVVWYRVLAYAVGGAFAGLAGGLTVLWVEQLTAVAFPTSLSITYLVVAVFSGPGYLGGLAVAALGIEGGRLFFAGFGPVLTYLAPIALIYHITFYPAGLNGAGRKVMKEIREHRRTRRSTERRAGAGEPSVDDVAEPEPSPEPLTWGLVGGVLAIAAGFVAVGVAWYHAGNTNQLWIQNQELISGGIGGICLVLLGVGLLIRDRLTRNNEKLTEALAVALGDVEPPLRPKAGKVASPTRPRRSETVAAHNEGAPRRRPLRVR